MISRGWVQGSYGDSNPPPPPSAFKVVTVNHSPVKVVWTYQEKYTKMIGLIAATCAHTAIW